jgi:hypothetical protein
MATRTLELFAGERAILEELFTTYRVRSPRAEGLVTPEKPTTELLFSYGTLQLEAVQLSTFGRTLVGTPDVSAVARQMQASVSSVWRWWQTYQRAGPRGLRPWPTPGCPRASCARWSGSWHGAAPSRLVRSSGLMTPAVSARR